MHIAVRVLLTLSAAITSSGSATVLRAQSVSGTYELALCRAAPCVPGDTAAAYLTATVVLLDSAETARVALAPPRYDRAPANGCFRVLHYRRLGDSYAGIVAAAGLRWRAAASAPDTIRFLLYQSPDATYGVHLSSTADGLTGWGNSGGVGVAAITAPRDTVVAVRVADANSALCR